MDPASPPPKPVWYRRKGPILWTAVIVLAVVLAAVIGVRILAGATTPAHHFSFSFPTSSDVLACDCVRVTQTSYAFPTQASIKFAWWVSWTGANATVQLAIAEADGALVFLALAEYQQGNPDNLNLTWAQGGDGSFSGKGSPFVFVVDIIASPDFLPPNTTIWVNGTYTTPLI